MKYYDESNSANMSDDDDAVDIESDVSVLRRKKPLLVTSRDFIRMCTKIFVGMDFSGWR